MSIGPGNYFTYNNTRVAITRYEREGEQQAGWLSKLLGGGNAGYWVGEITLHLPERHITVFYDNEGICIKAVYQEQPDAPLPLKNYHIQPRFSDL